MQTEPTPQLTLFHIQVRPVERHEEPQYKALNEIGMFTALLDAIEIKDKLITADALALSNFEWVI